MTRVAIIGAGMAGLACARKLSDAGLAPIVFDKGRGIGGRIATKRVDEMRFDHGAQYVTARDPEFKSLLDKSASTGAAGLWDDGSGRARIVGVPGMSALARALSAGLDVRQNAYVSAVRRQADALGIHVGQDVHECDLVVITIPSPQIEGLLGADHPFVAQAGEAKYDPCLTLMAAINAPPKFIALRDETAELAWIAHDGSKPGRPESTPTSWVAQAGPVFSKRYLEEDPAQMTERMLPIFCDRIGVSLRDVVHARTHRWRYARVTTALGRPFLHTSEGIYAGGDWCLGPRVEAAWASGNAIAMDLLKRRD